MNKTSAKFKVMGYKVELTQEDCQTYDSLHRSLYKKAPQELKSKLNEASKEEIVEAIAELVIAASIKFDIPDLAHSLQATAESQTQVFEILGHKIKFTRDECRSYEEICAHLLENAPEALAEQLASVTDDELVNIMSDLLVEINERFDTQVA